MLDGLMGLREHITGSRAHCAADGSTAPDAATGERGDGGAAGRADGATAEGSLLGFIHARTAGEPEAQDQDCGKRTPAAALVLDLHPTSFVPALGAQLWICRQRAVIRFIPDLEGHWLCRRAGRERWSKQPLPRVTPHPEELGDGAALSSALLEYLDWCVAKLG